MSDLTCTIPKSDKGGNLNRFNSSITFTIPKSDDGGTLVNHTQLPSSQEWWYNRRTVPV